MDRIRTQTKVEEIASMYSLKKEVMLTMLQISRLDAFSENKELQNTLSSFRDTLGMIDRKISTLEA